MIPGFSPNAAVAKRVEKRSEPSRTRVRIRFSSLHKKLEDKVRRYVVSSLISEYNGVFGSVFTSRKNDERKDIRTTPDECFATIFQAGSGQNEGKKLRKEIKLQVANLSCGGMCVLFDTSELPEAGDQLDISLPFLETFGSIKGRVLGLG